MNTKSVNVPSRALRALIIIAVAFAMATSVAAAFSSHAQAADHAVTIKNFAFSPSSITIAPGDSVTWTNDDSTTHTVTGTGWGSGNLAPGATFTHIFATAGDYNYHCSIHTYMTGKVVASTGSSSPPPSTPGKPLLSNTLVLVLIAVAIIIIVAIAAIVIWQRSQKMKASDVKEEDQRPSAPP